MRTRHSRETGCGPGPRTRTRTTSPPGAKPPSELTKSPGSSERGDSARRTTRVAGGVPGATGARVAFLVQEPREAAGQEVPPCGTLVVAAGLATILGVASVAEPAPSPTSGSIEGIVERGGAPVPGAAVEVRRVFALDDSLDGLPGLALRERALRGQPACRRPPRRRRTRWGASSFPPCSRGLPGQRAGP